MSTEETPKLTPAEQWAEGIKDTYHSFHISRKQADLMKGVNHILFSASPGRFHHTTSNDTNEIDFFPVIAFQRKPTKEQIDKGEDPPTEYVALLNSQFTEVKVDAIALYVKPERYAFYEIQGRAGFEEAMFALDTWKNYLKDFNTLLSFESETFVEDEEDTE